MTAQVAEIVEDHVAQVSGRCYLQFALFHQVVNEPGMVIDLKIGAELQVVIIEYVIAVYGVIEWLSKALNQLNQLNRLNELSKLVFL